MNEKKAREYSISILDFEEQLEFKNNVHVKTILFIPERTSSKYLFRVIFSTISKEEDSFIFRQETKLYSRIRNALNTMEFYILDVKSNKVIAERIEGGFIVDSGKIQLVLIRRIRLKKNRKYNIIIKLPSKIGVEERFLKPLFIGGTPLRVYL